MVTGWLVTHRVSLKCWFLDPKLSALLLTHCYLLCAKGLNQGVFHLPEVPGNQQAEPRDTTKHPTICRTARPSGLAKNNVASTVMSALGDGEQEAYRKQFSLLESMADIANQSQYYSLLITVQILLNTTLHSGITS